jgi:hypothetical protein
VIEYGTCDGQPATLAYINEDWLPVAKAAATMIVATLEDGRKIVFAAKERVSDARQYERNEEGEFGHAAPDRHAATKALAKAKQTTVLRKEAQEVPATDMHPADADSFVAARDKSTRPGFLTPHTAQEMAGQKMFLNASETVGISVDPKGDVQNVFNNGGPKGGASKALIEAIENGGRTLDCYDGFLPSLYHQFGFEEDRRMKFNPEFAPQGWDFEKNDNPDIVFMSWRGYGRDGAAGALARSADRSTWKVPEATDEYTDDWDGAKDASRRNAIEHRRVGDSGGGRAGEGPQAHAARGQQRADAGADDWRDLGDARPWDEGKAQRGQPGNAGQFGPLGNQPKEETPQAKSKRATAALAAGRSKVKTKRGRSKGARTLVEQQSELAALLERARALQANITAVQEQHGLRQPEHEAARAAETNRQLEEAEAEEAAAIARGRKHETPDERKARENRETREAVQADREHQAMMRESDAERTGEEVARRIRNKNEMADLMRQSPEGAAAAARLRQDWASLSTADIERRTEAMRTERAKAAAASGKQGTATVKDFEDAKLNIRRSYEPDWTPEKFVTDWNNKIGMDPKVFKAMFAPGLDTMMSVHSEGGEFKVSGIINNAGGNEVGTFDRTLKPNDKSAYSAYFKLKKSVQGSDIGKKLLMGNVATYQALGYKRVAVSANIDIGGYAWAKYGYVPTDEAWDELRESLKSKLARNRGKAIVQRGEPGESEREAEDWDELDSDAQHETMVQWMRDSRDGYVESEIESWRDSGQPLEDAKKDIVTKWDQGDKKWAELTLKQLRKDRNGVWDAVTNRWIEEPKPPIPFNDDQLLAALKMKDYSSRYNDGTDDPEFEFDDEFLNETGKDYYATTKPLPGMYQPASEKLTPEMRESVIKALTQDFNTNADDAASELEAPDYISENIEEYQEDSWESMDSSDRLRLARDYGNATVTSESDDDYEDEETEDVTLEGSKSVKDQVAAMLEEDDPKALWKVADSPLGKALLIDSHWSGVLEFGDTESFDRFNKYVGRVKGNK